MATNIKKNSRLGKKVQRKSMRAKKKIAKADKIMSANKGVKGKRAGAARTSAQRKMNKADGTLKGLKGKAKRNPVKADNQKYFGKRGAKSMKLVGKAQDLSGSKKRVAKRTKHLTKRINRVIKRKNK